MKVNIIYIYRLEVSKIKMSAQIDGHLLSMLEKISNPIQQLTMKVKVHGVFAPPQQWKTTDEANPNIFTYSVQVFNKKFASGKIEPKKLTAHQIKELQQKNKKGAKKQSKQQQKPIQIDPNQELKKLQWQKLSDQQKFYRTSEDPYKMFSLLFPQKQISQQLQLNKIASIQSAVENQSIEIVLIRKPEINEEQIQKLKKSKPKTLNLGQLYEAKYKGSLKLSDFKTPGSTSTTQRVNFQFFGDLPAQCIKIESDKCYVLVQIQFDKALIPQVTEIKPTLEEVLPKVQNLSKKSVNIIQKLKYEIVRSIKAISQQYATFFAKQKQYVDDKKHSGTISALRQNQINKRRDLFLNQFINSGKFAILKERISQSLKAIIIDKFRKEKVEGSISKADINKTLSELNVFFHQFIEKVIDQTISNQSAFIHEDIVLNHQVTKTQRKQIINPIINQTKEEKQTRLAQEYQILNNVEKTQEKYLNLIMLNHKSIQSLEKYAKFCCFYKKYDISYALYKQILTKTTSVKYQLAVGLFLVQKRRIRQAYELFAGMIQSNQSTIAQKTIYNKILSFMYQIQGDILRSEKYLAIAQKYFQIKKNPHLKINPPKNPYLEPKPLIPKPQRYTSQLNHSESQQLNKDFIQILQNYHFYDLIGKALLKLDQSDKKKILKIKIALFEENHQQSLRIIDDMLEKQPKNLELLQIKAGICYNFDKIFESQEVFLYILKLKPGVDQACSAYLRLGYTYLNRKSWEDARLIFQKLVELKNNCSLGWLGLGIANLELSRLPQAQQAANLASIYNPIASEPADLLKKIRQIEDKRNNQNYKHLKNQY